MPQTILHHRFAPVIAACKTPLLARLLHMMAVYRQRQKLRGLEPFRRRDLGLSDDEIRAETARPFWDITGTGAEARHCRQG